MIEFEGFGGLKLVADAFGSPDDPPVLLVPSLGQVRQFWHGAAQALVDAGRYAICVDLRGHGDSEHARDGRYDLDAHVADMRAILATLPSRATVVAAGFGALVVMAAVGESGPHIVSALALVDANIWFEPTLTSRMGSAMMRRSADFADPDTIIDVIAEGYPGEPRPQAHEGILAAYRRRADGRYEWRGDTTALGAIDMPREQERFATAAAKIATPVTLIRGSLNETVTNDTMTRLQQVIQGSEVAEIEGAGHYAAIDRIEAFNSVLLDFLERKAPRQPLSFIGGSEPRVLRDALGCFGTGVTIVTTIDGDGNPLGLTANSFTSVSLDPPLILFSLAKSSANLDNFTSARGFAVNVLHIGQQPDAWRFAKRDSPRFDGVDWAIRNEGGAPILHGSLASFDCKTFAVHEGGDHLIFIGEVEHAWFEPHRDPLLYFRGKFRRLHFD